MAFRSIRLHAQHQANRHYSLPAPTHSTSLDISLTHPFKITFKWLRDLSNPLPDTSSAVPLREAVRIATEEFGILQGTAANPGINGGAEGDRTLDLRIAHGTLTRKINKLLRSWRVTKGLKPG